jgi:hypothetical protein
MLVCAALGVPVIAQAAETNPVVQNALRDIDARNFAKAAEELTPLARAA